jgi:Flp pilus assembly protein TadG
MFVRTARQAGTEEGGRGRGQALAEFALIIPIILIVFMGIVEIALAYNATVGVNRASQNGAHLAAIMGNQLGADCLILTEIEGDVYAPNDRNKIQEVIIERSNKTGTTWIDPGFQTWTRTPSTPTACTLPDGTASTVPYTLDVNNYPETARCSVLKGCDDLTPPRSTVDNIGVSIRYRHLWATPLNAAFEFFGGGNTGWTIVQKNVFRIEPVL